MYKSIWIAGAVLALASSFATAAESDSATRQQRMDAALADYRATHPSDPSVTVVDDTSNCDEYTNGGAFARAEAAVKRGACKTGHAIERGVKKTGHAIDKAGRKTGDALRRTGEKLGGSPEKATSDPQPR